VIRVVTNKDPTQRFHSTVELAAAAAAALHDTTNAIAVPTQAVPSTAVSSYPQAPEQSATPQVHSGDEVLPSGTVRCREHGVRQAPVVQLTSTGVVSPQVAFGNRADLNLHAHEQLIDTANSTAVGSKESLARHLDQLAKQDALGAKHGCRSLLRKREFLTDPFSTTTPEPDEVVRIDTNL
jgi:hypothetical protein